MTKEQDENIRCYFVVNDDCKRKLLLECGVNNVISNKTLKNKILIFNAKTWICSTIETPVTSFFKKRIELCTILVMVCHSKI